MISKRKRPLVGSWKAYNCFSQTEKRNERQKGKRRSDKEIKREKERNSREKGRSSVFIELVRAKCF